MRVTGVTRRPPAWRTFGAIWRPYSNVSPLPASAEALDRRLHIEGRQLDVFVQVNTSGDASKYGLVPHAVADFLQALPAFPALRVRGLMTLALFSADVARVRPCHAG